MNVDLGDIGDSGELGVLLGDGRELNVGLLGSAEGKVLLGRGGEVVDGGIVVLSAAAAAAGDGVVDEGLGLGSVVTHVLLGSLGGLLGVLLGNGAELGRLGANDLTGVVELVVDDLTVGGVDERDKEENRGGDDGQTPVGNDLDEVVCDKGRDSGLDAS